jgi:GH43 family beta-xylosidase
MRKTKIIISLTLAMLLASCTSLSTSNSSSEGSSLPSSIPDGVTEPVAPEVRDLYENSFGEDRIPDQWDAYGVGDPFVYRWNGVYYLYVSTKDSETGVRGWKSLDLVNWEKITGVGLEEGYVSDDPITKAAYAPEVMYLNGKFYMLTSPGGNGHYMLRADAPEGPFVAITGNFGQSIDGSFFQDDDEKIYMTRSNSGNIRIAQLKSDWTANTLTLKTLDNTQIGNWTEGSYILRRHGINYITYTGTHVTSAGYRVGYSWSESSPIAPAAYTQDQNNIILSTSPDFNGLGHSATVLGPDMDSHYIVYHNLLNSGGPIRAYSMNRLFFNGTDMMASNVKRTGNIVPSMAAFSSHDAATDLDVSGAFLLSEMATDEQFTAEWNFTGTAGQAVFAYNSDTDYSYISWNGTTIEVHKVDGSDNLLHSVALKSTHPTDVLHTFRVIYRDGLLDLQYDNMTKISGLEVALEPGKIGYKDFAASAIGYTGFSHHARGSSDNAEFKQEKALANSFDIEHSEFDNGSTLEKLTTGFVSPSVKTGSYDLDLKAGDKARYLHYFDEEGYYSLSMAMPVSMMGKYVTISVDETVKRMQVPTYELDASVEYIQAELGRFPIHKGSHYVSISAEEGIRFNSYTFDVATDSTESFDHDLTTLGGDAMLYANVWKIKNGGHYATSGNRQLLYIGKPTIRDATIEADLNFDGATAASTAGFLLRAGNEAFSVHENNDSIQGYYVALNNAQISLRRKDYNWTRILDSAGGTFASGSDHTLRVSISGNRIIISVNGVEYLNIVDPSPFGTGHLGLYTDGAATTYKNLSITLG